MSQTTQQNSREPGDNRRRRSRGGQNRNNKNRNHDNRDSGQNRGRDGEGRPQNNQGRQSRSDEFRPRSASGPARRYSPPKLTFWQKILKAVGLYKVPEPKDSKPVQRPENDRSSQKPNRNQDGERPQRKQEGGEKIGGNRREGGNRERGERLSRGGNVATVGSPRVYVGNLSYDVGESDLQELFKGIGPVRNVEVVYNRSTHRSKGYGFIEMVSIDDAKRCVEVLHDQPFMGRKLNVSGALSKGQDSREEKEERSDRPSMPTLAPLPAVAKTVQEEAQAIAAANGQSAATAEQPTHHASAEHAPEVIAATENVEATGAPQVIIDAVQHQVEEAVEEHEAKPV